MTANIKAFFPQNEQEADCNIPPAQAHCTTLTADGAGADFRIPCPDTECRHLRAFSLDRRITLEA